MNVITLMGRITADPELKNTPNGVAVVSFTLAVDRSYTPKGQDKQTDFINCVAWRNTAECIAKYFSKGQRMAVKGALQQRTYTANDGGNRSVYEVVVDEVFFCETKKTDSAHVTQPSVGFDNGGFDNDGFEEIASLDDVLPF